jgi:hypothetical protein
MMTIMMTMTMMKMTMMNIFFDLGDDEKNIFFVEECTYL